MSDLEAATEPEETGHRVDATVAEPETDLAVTC